MKVTNDTVKNVAHLARISLTSAEMEKLSRQLEDILDFIDKLKETKLDNVNPTYHILPIHNVMREDAPQDSLPIEKTLLNAPRKDGNTFSVPKIIE